jgi:enoyl-CoA hydratase/carnithine racemase
MDVLGLAASAAATFVMAGDEIVMRDGSRIMIHRPFTGQPGGTSEESTRMGEELRSLEKDLERIYSERMKISMKEIREMMKTEKHFSPEEAEKMGFAKRAKSKEGKLKNYWKSLPEDGFKVVPQIYANLPDEYDPSEIKEPKQDKSGIEKKDVKIGEHTFPLTEGEIQMLTQIQEALGVKKFEDIIPKLKELIAENMELSKEPEPQPQPSEPQDGAMKTVIAENRKLMAEVATLKTGFQSAMSEIEEQKEFRLNQKVKQRDDKLIELKKNGYVSEIEVERAKQFWNVSPDSYQIYVEGLEADEPKYKNLLEDTGSAGDGPPRQSFVTSEEKGTATAQEVNLKVQEMKAENKELKTQQALDVLEQKEPELMKRYYNGE